MVYTILNLVYSKEHILSIRLTYSEHITIDIFCFIGIYFMVISTWTCVGVISFMIFYSTIPYVFLMYYQLVFYVVEKVFSYGPYFLLIVFSRMALLFLMVYRYIYSSKYSSVSLYFTNWSFLLSFLKSLPKLQPKPSLRL